jgi:type II secretory pathway pseudopilin PulG
MIKKKNANISFFVKPHNKLWGIPQISIWGSRQKGYTLLELILVLTFIVMASAVVCMAFVTGLRMFYAEDNRMGSFIDASAVLDGMILDLRHATSFVSKTATTMSFVKNGVTISYSWDNGAKTVSRSESGDTAVLLGGVENLSFSYDNPATTKYVSVFMILKNADNVISTFESGGGPRNL